jgi:hypothetical protein
MCILSSVMSKFLRQMSDTVFGIFCWFDCMYYSLRIRGQTVPQIDSTRHVCRISLAKHSNTDHKKSRRHKIQDEPLSPHLPAASPSLSMATSAMDQYRFVAAPHESDADGRGARRPGLRALRLVLLFGVWGVVMAPIKKMRDGRGASVLDGRCSMDLRNNQPNDGVGGGGGGWWRGDSHGWNAWGRTFAHRFRGGEWSDEKKENREGDGASDCDGSVEWRDATTNRKSAASLEYILARRRAGLRRFGRTPSHLFGLWIKGQKNK